MAGHFEMQSPGAQEPGSPHFLLLPSHPFPLQSRKPQGPLAGAEATLPGSQQRLPRAGIRTRAAAARRMVLPIRILQLCRAAHLHLSPEDADQKIRLAVASVWSVIVESEIVCK